MAAQKKKKIPLEKRLDIETYPYVECREQHVWGPYDGRMDLKAGLAYRTQICRCGTKRHSLLSLRERDKGQLVCPSTYTYPTDYRVPGGLDKADRGLVRFHNFLAELR